ncbi:MAG: type I-B CRISPR-associated endonuclease Cas1b [Candidatus Aenigmatarchaeota archaeon]
MSLDNYYIVDDGKILMKNTTVYFINKERKVDIPIENIYSLYFIGSGSISTKVLKEFQKRKIIVNFFGKRGDYIGSFYPKEHYISGDLVVRQVKRYLDDKSRLKFASKFVEGAINNIDWICRRFNLGEINKPDISSSDTIESLMQREGLVRKQFYSLIDERLDDSFKITRREINPPSNRGNAIISFLNSMVYSTVLSEIYHTHLNPAVSFLHEPFERRFSLSLDVSEIFKPLLSERLLIKMVNLKMLDPILDFESNDGVFLSKIGIKKIIKEFDDEIKKSVKGKSNRLFSIRELIRLELYKIEKDLLDISEYKPLKAWW